MIGGKPSSHRPRVVGYCMTIKSLAHDAWTLSSMLKYKKEVGVRQKTYSRNTKSHVRQGWAGGGGRVGGGCFKMREKKPSRLSSFISVSLNKPLLY